MMFVILFILGCFGGFLSGLLGLGGAVIMIPLMLFVPPIFGFPELAMKTVAGLSMIQVLASSISGMIIHKKNKCFDKKAFINIGIPMGIFSLLGAHFSKYLNDLHITILFGTIVLLSLLMLLVHKNSEDEENIDEYVPCYQKKYAVLTGSIVGCFSGIVGSGGGFILIPIMIMIFKIPIRLTIGTSLSIVFIGAVMGSIGKIISMQVNFPLAAVIVISSIPSAIIGAKVSKKLPRKTLKCLLIIIILISLFQVWAKILGIEIF